MTEVAEQITVSVRAEEVARSKRAVVVLMECFKAAMGGKQAPLEMRQDVQALMGLIRKVDKL